MKSLWLKALLAVGSTFVTAALIIGYAFWVHQHPPVHEFFHTSPNSYHEFSVKIHGRRLLVRQHYNSWGMLGYDPPARTKNSIWILAIGGSTTQGLIHNAGRDWPARLQSLLRTQHPNVWVGNAGICGQSTKGHLRFLQEFVPRIRPQLAIFLVGANDLASELQSDLPVAMNHPPGSLWRYWLLLVRVRLREAYSVHAPAGGVWAGGAPFVGGQNDAPAAELLKKGDPILHPSDLDLAKLTEPYRQRLQAIIAACRRQNVRPIFLTQPMFYEDSAAWRPYRGLRCAVQGKRGYISAADYAQLMNLFNRVLTETARQGGVPVVDVTQAIPHRPEYYIDEVHFLENGADLLARQVAEFINQKGLI